MADYLLRDARFTMVLIRKPQAGGNNLFERAGFDLVRFNVDVDPSAPQFIMPVGSSDVVAGVKPDQDKQYESIQTFDSYPFRERAYFGNRPA